MKIAYCADIHGDLEAFRIYRDWAKTKNDLDVIISAGDLIAPIFNDEEMQALGQATAALLQIKQQNQLPEPLEEIARELIWSPRAPNEVVNVAKLYSAFNERAKSSTKEQYKKFFQLFSSLGLPVYTIPGNWDTVNMEENIGPANLHLYREKINDITFAGYGSSPENMLGVLPLDLVHWFNAAQAYHFLIREDPDVCITHCQPYGLCDSDGNGNHIGNFALLSYLLEQSPNVMLVAHNHIPAIQQKGQTIVINPGSLGRYEADTGRHQNNNFGTFVEFELGKKNYFEKAKFYQIHDLNSGIESIKPTQAFCMSDKGELIKDEASKPTIIAP